jgi:hypothetical protein
VTVNPATLTPTADSISVVPVVVSIPAGTAPGQYPVTLTAKLANGAQRSANGTLTVLPAGAPGAPPIQAGALDAANPGVTLYAPNGTLRLGPHTRTLKVVSLNVNRFFLAGSSALFFAGDASGRAHRADNSALPIATQGLGLPAGQHTDIYYNLSETALTRLRKRRSFPVVVALRLFDVAGHSTNVTARYTLVDANQAGK